MKPLFFFLLLLPFFTQAQIITTVAGNSSTLFPYGDGGPAIDAELTYPMNLVFDDSGNYYIINALTPNLRKVNTSGIISTIAGDSTGFAGDGGPASSAKFGETNGLAIDKAGNLYISDPGNARIRKISTTGIVSTVAGNGTSGYSGDGGPATSAMIHSPTSVSFDKIGSLYITEEGSNCVRKVDTYGTITTVAGNDTVGYSGDGGPATAAKLNGPFGVAFDAAGNMFIADTYNEVIRKVNTSGTISTFAGNGTAGFSGDSGLATAAELYSPDELVFDRTGNLFFSDADNQRIRKIDTSGIITTIAGNGINGFYGDGGLATAAELDAPYGLCFDKHGNLYFADNIYSRIRMIALGDISITDSYSVCLGATTTLSVTATGGVWSSNNTSIATVSGTGIVTGVASGTDTISYTAAGATTSFKLIVDASPVAGTISTTADSLCLGAIVTLTSSAPGGSWFNVDTVNAAVTSIGTLEGLSIGIDTVYYIVTNACGADTARKVIPVRDCPMDIKGPVSNILFAYISIYPNPAHGSFNVTFNTSGKDDVQMTMYNIKGQKVKEWIMSPNKKTVVQLNVPPGSYYVSTMLEHNILYTRLLIE